MDAGARQRCRAFFLRPVAGGGRASVSPSPIEDAMAGVPMHPRAMHATMSSHPCDDPAMSDLDVLRSLALHAAQQAYAPYSKLRVGAALRSAAGHAYTGCNVENASYTLGNCAERAAIAAAVQAEGPAFRLAAIAVTAFDRTGNPLPISPCGGCRQALVEFGEHATVSFRQPDGQWLDIAAGALLPHRFSFPER